MHGDEGACGDRVVASHRATGEDGKDGQETAIDKLAAATVGDGAISDAMKDRVLISAPPDQRATDSHDYLFLSVENSKHLAGQNIGHPLFDPVLLQRPFLTLCLLFRIAYCRSVWLLFRIYETKTPSNLFLMTFLCDLLGSFTFAKLNAIGLEYFFPYSSRCFSEQRKMPGD